MRNSGGRRGGLDGQTERRMHERLNKRMVSIDWLVLEATWDARIGNVAWDGHDVGMMGRYVAMPVFLQLVIFA